MYIITFSQCDLLVEHSFFYSTVLSKFNRGTLLLLSVTLFSVWGKWLEWWLGMAWRI